MGIKTEISEFLRELGLRKAEIAVYLAALELGSASASTIAKEADLNRITAYEALKRLSRKGFIRIRAKKSDATKYFVPVEYSELVGKLKLKHEELAETIKRAGLLKKEFEANFTKVDEKPVVLYYEGVEGVKEVLNDTLKDRPKEIISFASAESLDESLDQNFLDSYWQKRTTLGIPTRGIMPNTSKATALFTKEKNQREMRRIKFISDKSYDFKNELDIYGDNISMISLEKGKEHAVIIRSRSMAEGLRAVYETLWNLT
ncbi:MAG: helix-turn-helix domain-containing protein [Candidatus Pacebacteria bacterium]|nr:helix-turn-helix domain-containing protein [Candidatus Paceibacterota bacterium]MDD5356804.1 helix-turn-helix domain-containing protein [Candidatus Paceibacterota bacterium]